MTELQRLRRDLWRIDRKLDVVLEFLRHQPRTHLSVEDQKKLDEAFATTKDIVADVDETLSSKETKNG